VQIDSEIARRLTGHRQVIYLVYICLSVCLSVLLANKRIHKPLLGGM